MIRISIMLTEQQLDLLKRQSRLRHKTIAELVRDALDRAFLEDPVKRRRHMALAAYQEGMISLGKLAGALGLNPMSAQQYLKARGIPLVVQELGDISMDAK